jgi:RNA polymerase sigma-70 factor (ECF subfamily)
VSGGSPASSNALDLAGAYREYRPAIFKYLRRATGDVGLAEELTQEVFLAALVARPSSSKAGKPLLAWLYVIARRRAIDAARKARRTTYAALEEVAANEGIDEGRVRARAIADGIRALPVEQQRVVLLRLVSGLSFAEIATAVGSDAAACRMRFSRGLRALRVSLDKVVLALTVAIGELMSDGLDAVCV